ncbi:hemolysin family protein [Anaerolinea sp.]|uniref:hemolysin family protein n=1 Tax=Anaerolinea sp. TaxID=1872519 RepID=UPI002ACE2B76|nr:hemolysin family protein [Anaerolinea sp.]
MMVSVLVALLIGILLLDLLFSAVRGSVINARLPSLMEMGEERPEKVRDSIAVLQKPRLRTTVRVMLFWTHLFIIFLGLMLMQNLFPQTRMELWLLGLVLIGLIVLFLEHLVEGGVLEHAEEWTIRFTPLARFLDGLFSPLTTPLLHLLGSPQALQQRFISVTESELRTWVKEGEPEGSLDQDEREMIYSIFHFGEKLCREIMVPRIDMSAVEIQTPLEEVIQILTRTGHSRLPVYEETVDNIIGLLYAKDLLKVRPEEGQTLESLRNILRPAYFVPEAKRVKDLLEEMQEQRIHMAIVVDEYGGVAGLVTLEDIVEEIVGEIRDEYDQSEEQPYQKISEDEYLFQARIDLDDFNEIMGTHIEKDLADTIGGLMYGLIGQVPTGGETVQIENVLLKVEQVTGRRIRKVRATRIHPVSDEHSAHGENDHETER